MTDYNHTIAGGGTVGHPGNVPRPYMVQSRIFDAADQNLLANDVVKMIDVPDNTMVIGGCIDVLEAGGSGLTYDVGLSTSIDAFADGVDGNADAIYQFTLKAGGINTVIAADAIQVKALGAGVTAGRFRVIAIMCDIGTGPKQTASVTTGT